MSGKSLQKNKWAEKGQNRNKRRQDGKQEIRQSGALGIDTRESDIYAVEEFRRQYTLCDDANGFANAVIGHFSDSESLEKLVPELEEIIGEFICKLNESSTSPLQEGIDQRQIIKEMCNDILKLIKENRR